jgi:hypothetical protein
LNLKELQFLIERRAIAQELRGADHRLGRNAQWHLWSGKLIKNQSLARLAEFTLKRD